VLILIIFPETNMHSNDIQNEQNILVH